MRQNIKDMKHFLISISLLLLFAACSKDDDKKNEPLAKGRRTVIVFMSADNSLSYNNIPQNDINKMITYVKSGKLSGDDRFVIYVDRYSVTEKPFIARLVNDKNNPVDTLYKYSVDPYSSDPAKFKEILSRCMELCPANEYGLVLWGHGSGWIIQEDITKYSSSAPRRAYGIDNGNTGYENKGPWLNIPDMRKAFEEMGIKWKFIFSDCCNMMCAELAYELRNCTEYLIGSPAEIPGSGAPYDTASEYFFSQSDDFYDGIVNAYAEKHQDNLPLSAIRTSEMESLASATREILPYVATHLKKGDDEATRDIIYYYSPGGQTDNVNKALYDMNDMILASLAAEPELYTRWHNAFSKAVVSRVISPYWDTNHWNTVNFNDFTVTDEKMGSVSMHFPLEKYNNSRCEHKYNTDIKKLQWYDAVGWSTVGY